MKSILCRIKDSIVTRRSFLETLAISETGSFFLKPKSSEAVSIEELPPGVSPSNPRELLYPTPEPSSKLFTKESGSIVASYPLLQNVSENSASVSWALNLPATGWVEWGTTPQLGKFARNSEFGLNPYAENFLSARICGLAPNTRYYYRTATCSFAYKTAYEKTISEPQYSAVYSFQTVGPKTDEVSFAVMNDLHNQVDVVREHCKRHQELNSDLVIWNGDVCHRYFFPLIAKTSIANPCDMPFAAERPFVFVPGNHDKWGPYAHRLQECLTPWRQHDPRFQSLGYNTAFRHGPVAMITLDTGINSSDDIPKNQGIMSCEPYRELQAAWLESVLNRPDIVSAPFIVAFCHIPLINPFAKNDKPTSPLKWEAYEPYSAKLWGPILERHNITLMISAHLHKFGYLEASQERPWPLLLGGGPLLENATCIHAKANSNELVVTSEKLSNKEVQGVWKFRPRV